MINVPFQKVKQREEEKKTTPFLMIQKSWVLVLRGSGAHGLLRGFVIFNFGGKEKTMLLEFSFREDCRICFQAPVLSSGYCVCSGS